MRFLFNEDSNLDPEKFEMNLSYKRCGVFVINSHNQIGFVITSSVNSTDESERKQKKSILVGRIVSWGIQWVSLVKLHEDVYMVPVDQWTDFKFWDKYLICLSSDGQISFFGDITAQGTSRSSILGEATINLADYADASQPAAISLPLVGSDHGTILHVSVQLLTAKTRFREFEQQRDKGLQSGNNVDKETEPNTARSSSSQLEMLDDREMNKTQETNIHEECSNSHVTFDGSSNASENYNTHDVDSVKSKVSASQSPPTENLHKDVAIDSEENHRLRGSLEAAELSITKLKM
ncbi:hypothetical protein Tco_0462300 [Tanacetum coccineum]